VIRVGVLGAAGRMGREVRRAVASADDLEIVAAVDPQHGGEDADGLEIAARGSVVQRARVVPGMARVDQRRLVAEKRPHGGGVATVDRLEQLRLVRGVTPIDLSLEGPPAGESMLLSHRQQRHGELRVRILLSEDG